MEEVPQYLIYGLLDPRDQLVHYVGKSETGLERPQCHRRPSTRKRKSKDFKAWLDELDVAGVTFEIVVLQVVYSPKARCQMPIWWDAQRNPTELAEAERWWIALGRMFLWPLKNKAEGGEGSAGFKHSEEARQKMSAAGQGKKRSPEAVAKITAAVTGQVRKRRHGSDTMVRSGCACELCSAALEKNREASRLYYHAKSGGAWWYGPVPLCACGCGLEVTRHTSGRPYTFLSRHSVRSQRYPRKKYSSHRRSRDVPYQGEHGTLNMYQHARWERRQGRPHCGPCEPCKEANLRYQREYRARKKKEGQVAN